MRVLLYKDLDLRRVKASFAKVRAALEAGDFRSPSIKKMQGTPFWRAKLSDADRLLLQFTRVDGQTVCLALEVILNHAYEHSRFLRGALVDEARIEREPEANPADAHGLAALTTQDAAASLPALPALRWLHPQHDEFELLDKPLMFDEAQEAVCRLPLPVVVVGSAGSGKTAVTLTRLRQASGRVLYVTQSAYLAQSARALYGAHGYANAQQEVEFLSYRELLETLRMPAGRELSFAAFVGWFERHRAAVRQNLGELDAHALFEEFRGVLSADAAGPLSLAAYLALGTRQSLLAPAARPAAHALFERYREWLQSAHLFDLNLLAFEWRALAQPVYDLVVVDEVQDLTAVQLALVLACLKKPGEFLLCGDANQIVHPNFFSWAAVRALFWRGLVGEVAQRQNLSVLHTNFRNTRAVTRLANDLLKIKQARFGSVDKDSNFLVQPASSHEGEVLLLPAKEAVLRELDERSRASTHHAVVVLRDEDKFAARQRFRTPLVFSVHEAKGLEYPHVILWCLVSGQRTAYAQVCEGVTPADVAVAELAYSRAKDKGDKSLELYKFYVNALYVAMTRAVESLTLVESDTAHPLLALLGLQEGQALGAEPVRQSSREEWAQEARKLELQGKAEQAQAIRETFLLSKPVPWQPWSQALIAELLPKALDKKQPSAKPRQTLFDYAMWHGQPAWVERLADEVQFAPARQLVRPGQPYVYPFLPQDLVKDKESGELVNQLQIAGLRTRNALLQKHLAPFAARNFKDVLRECDVYGVDHLRPTGQTSLALAALAGNIPLVDALLARGANPYLADEYGHTAWLAALNFDSHALTLEETSAQRLALLFERLGPASIDVQTGGRLVRLERHQAEFWVLQAMWLGLKLLMSRAVLQNFDPWKNSKGLHAEWLEAWLAPLPTHLWPEHRRKRAYLSSVLGRAEVSSTYAPARQLWVRTTTGYYFPNPEMRVRAPANPAQADGPQWLPLHQALNLAWVRQGSYAARHSRVSSLLEDWLAESWLTQAV
jgi:hypothetical protein